MDKLELRTSLIWGRKQASKSKRHKEFPSKSIKQVNTMTYSEKLQNTKRILKAARDKWALTYKGRHIRVVVDLSTETWQARREWQEIFNVLNRKNMQPRILYPARLSFRIEGEIKVFPNKNQRSSSPLN